MLVPEAAPLVLFSFIFACFCGVLCRSVILGRLSNRRAIALFPLSAMIAALGWFFFSMPIVILTDAVDPSEKILASRRALLWPRGLDRSLSPAMAPKLLTYDCDKARAPQLAQFTEGFTDFKICIINDSSHTARLVEHVYTQSFEYGYGFGPRMHSIQPKSALTIPSLHHIGPRDEPPRAIRAGRTFSTRLWLTW